MVSDTIMVGIDFTEVHVHVQFLHSNLLHLSDMTVHRTQT
jgi:hypothetical protein